MPHLLGVLSIVDSDAKNGRRGDRRELPLGNRNFFRDLEFSEEISLETMGRSVRKESGVYRKIFRVEVANDFHRSRPRESARMAELRRS